VAKKIRKTILIGIILVMLFALANVFVFSDGACDCTDSYMGATYVGSVCTYVGGVLVFRRCIYAY
jgi:uncharacterized protein YxeA